MEGLRRFVRQLNLSPFEMNKAIVSLVLYFTIILTYYLIKPAKEALFLQYMGSKFIPYSLVIIACSIGVVVKVYEYFVRRCERNVFNKYLAIVCSASMIIIWLLLRLPHKNVGAFVLYVWSDLFSVVSVTLFWSIMNDMFSIETAKKLYFIIGIGSEVGGIVGSQITGYLAPRIGTENILPIAAALYLSVIFMVNKVHRLDISDPEKAKAACEIGKAAPEERRARGKESGLSLILKSRHLIFFGLMIAIMAFNSVQMRFQVQKMVEIHIPDKDAKTVFWSNNYSLSNAVSLIVLLCFANLIFKYLGLFFSLYLLPIASLGFSFVFIGMPVLPVVAMALVINQGLKYGLNQVNREMLYIPCSVEERYKAKAYIDILFYRISSIVAAAEIFISNNILHLSVSHYNYLIMTVLVLYVFVVFKLKGAYYRRLRDFITKKAEEMGLGRVPAAPTVDKEDLDARMRALGEGRKGGRLEDFLKENRTVIEWAASALGGLSRNENVYYGIILMSECGQDKSVYSICYEYVLDALPKAMRKPFSAVFYC